MPTVSRYSVYIEAKEVGSRRSCTVLGVKSGFRFHTVTVFRLLSGGTFTPKVLAPDTQLPAVCPDGTGIIEPFNKVERPCDERRTFPSYYSRRAPRKFLVLFTTYPHLHETTHPDSRPGLSSPRRANVSPTPYLRIGVQDTLGTRRCVVEPQTPGSRGVPDLCGVKLVT